MANTLILSPKLRLLLLILLLSLPLACRTGPGDAASPETTDESAARIDELRGQLSQALKERREALETAEVRGENVAALVDAFLREYPYSKMSEAMRAALGELGVDPEHPEGFYEVGLDEFLALANGHSFFERYPYHTLPPGLAQRFSEMGIEPGDPATYRQVDPLQFAAATADFAWDSHVWQVKAQQLANRRGAKIEELSGENSRLGRDLQSATLRAERMGREVARLDRRLDREIRSHGETRREKSRLEEKMTAQERQARARREEALRRIENLEAEKRRAQRLLELERRGGYYQRAMLTVERLLRIYQHTLEEMERYYDRQLLLVSDFAYEINEDGSVTGIDDRSGFENHSVWVRTEPGDVEEKHFQRRWKAFRENVEYAIKVAEKSRKKSDYEAAKQLSAELESILRRVPEKLWLRVETPSGGKFRLDLSQRIDPLMQRVESWRRM